MAQGLQTGLDIFQQVREEVDRVLNQFGGTGFGLSRGTQQQQQGGRTGNLTAPAEAIEEENAYRLTLDIPGVDPREVEISVSGNNLLIQAERRQEQDEKGRNYLVRERAYGVVRREFHLSDDVDRNRIGADFRNGVLTITLPRSQEARSQRRRIEIKSS